MTENEKKLLQAKHRLEEAQMRDRNKERKARTRRLIQEGGNFGESITSYNTDDIGTVGGIFVRGIQGNTMIFMRSGQPGRFSFIPKGALTHHPEGAVVLPAATVRSARRMRLLRKPYGQCHITAVLLSLSTQLSQAHPL